uniref:Uncharacterized protein n=1 Tax=Hyaloperonospora arabidopsidis (strain Emoy2) TaxID=559515 RepID=M4B329_HYAAE
MAPMNTTTSSWITTAKYESTFATARRRIDRKLDTLVEAGALRYIELGGGTRAIDSQLLEQVCYRGAVKMADPTQLHDYNKRIDQSVGDELTKLMEGLTCVSVGEYIGADDDESI